MRCIEFRDISKVFNVGEESAKQAIAGINLSIPSGQWCNLLGPNGSGKSTLLKILAGEMDPSTGDVLVDERSILRDSAAKRARTFFFVEQDTRANLVSSMTIEENLLLAVCSSPFPGLGFAQRRSRRKCIQEALAQLGMGLEQRLATQVRLLSGGERQAVVIAKALVTAAPVLLLDEFLGAMDPQSGPTLLRIVHELARRQGITVISVTHNLEQITMVPAKDSRIVLLRKGEIAHDLPLRDLPSLEWLVTQYEGINEGVDAKRVWR